ncbi:hypothetical protein RA264_28430, partial [Pseudomonas syringae pv. tagetis]|uniref:hypothetical protein n=1 Tax=Pseudomonas syringae group genomosp. 7 TaxID=251699 RepID=UPI0037701F88
CRIIERFLCHAMDYSAPSLIKERVLNYVERVKDSLRTFATEEVNNSIVLKGAWGTGITFLWDEIVKTNSKYF